MATTSFRETWVNFILIGLFIFASISFIVISQDKNEVDNSILENPIINSTYNKLEQKPKEKTLRERSQREALDH